MRKTLIWSLITSLILSIAAPYGAVFASTEIFEDSGPPSEGLREVVESPESKDLPQLDNSVSAVRPSEAPENIISDASSLVVPATPNEESEAVGIAPVVQEDPLPNQSSGVVISRVQMSGGQNRTKEELIELYNNSLEAVDITGWCVAASKSATVELAAIGCIQSSDGVGWRVFLPGRTTFIFASSSFVRSNLDAAGNEFAADQIFKDDTFNNGDGRVVLWGSAGQLVDAVTWGSKLVIDQGRSYVAANSSSTTLERRLLVGEYIYQDTDDSASDFVLDIPRSVYTVGGAEEVFDACLNIPDLQSNPGSLFRNEETGECTERPVLADFCHKLRLSEVAANVSDQFIELQNISDETVDASGCQLQTKTRSKTYTLPESTIIEAGGYQSVKVADSELTLIKTTSDRVYLLSSDGKVEIDSVEYNGLAKETSWSLVGEEWLQTYTLTPGGVNVYSRWPACESGYERNELSGRCNKLDEPSFQAPCRPDQYRSQETGRCRSLPVERQLLPCRDGQYRSEETNRCRSIASAVSALRPCADDQFRNPETNRCKKIASRDDVALVDCGEGRERNPATNRCRNVLSSAMPKADFAPEKVVAVQQGMIGWWAFGGMSLVALSYAAWQWRFEAGRLVARIKSSFTSSQK